MHANLMTDRQQIANRVEAKRSRLVTWLRDEVYTDYQTAALVLGVTPATAYKALQAMERDGLVSRHVVGRSSVWALTITGQLTYLQEGDDPLAVFEGRVSEVTVRHTLAIQRARLAAEANGWSDWTPERRMRRAAAAAKQAGQPSPLLRVPDGIATDPAGRRVAVEIERTAKTPKRYADIMADYLVMRKAGVVMEVHYLCETERLAVGLSRLFHAIKSVNVKGADVALKPEHYKVFQFCHLAAWPKCFVSADAVV